MSILISGCFIKASGKTKLANSPPRNTLACSTLISTAAVNYSNTAVFYNHKPVMLELLHKRLLKIAYCYYSTLSFIIFRGFYFE